VPQLQVTAPDRPRTGTCRPISNGYGQNDLDGNDPSGEIGGGEEVPVAYNFLLVMTNTGRCPSEGSGLLGNQVRNAEQYQQGKRLD
jgi:hypothetical protein